MIPNVRNVRYESGDEIVLSQQLYERTREAEQAWDDVESGRVEWDPDSVDWDALEEMYEDA